MSSLGCGGLANHQTSSSPTGIQQKKHRLPKTMCISSRSPGRDRPRRKFPEFPAALSFLPILPPAEAARQLDRRAETLAARLAEREATLAAVDLPRLFLIEDEYRLAMMRTELDWVRALAAELRAGTLTWSGEWLADWTGSRAD